MTVNLICLETVDVEPIVRKAAQSSNSKQHSILITRLVQQDEEENTAVDYEGTQLLEMTTKTTQREVHCMQI